MTCGRVLSKYQIKWIFTSYCSLNVDRHFIFMEFNFSNNLCEENKCNMRLLHTITPSCSSFFMILLKPPAHIVSQLNVAKLPHFVTTYDAMGNKSILKEFLQNIHLWFFKVRNKQIFSPNTCLLWITSQNCKIKITRAHMIAHSHMCNMRVKRLLKCVYDVRVRNPFFSVRGPITILHVKNGKIKQISDFFGNKDYFPCFSIVLL